jgi:hypothetical protein
MQPPNDKNIVIAPEPESTVSHRLAQALQANARAVAPIDVKHPAFDYEAHIRRVDDAKTKAEAKRARKAARGAGFSKPKTS